MLLKSTVSSSASVSPVYGSDRGRRGPCLSLLGTLFEFSSTADAAAAAVAAAARVLSAAVPRGPVIQRAFLSS